MSAKPSDPIDSERRFRALFEQAAVGVALIETATGRFVEVNRKYQQIIGYTDAEMSALDFMRITHSDDLREDLAQMERLVAGEIREFALEKRLVRKSGEPVWIALAVSAMWAPGAAPSFHVAVVQDISARKLAEEKTLHARAELESTLEALPDLFFDIDDEGRIYDFRAPNPEQLAVPPEVFLGRTMRDVLPPEVAEIVDRAIADALANGRSGGHSYTLTIGGVSKHFEISLARKSGGAGRPRLVAIARETTARVVAENQRRSLEAQLRQSQKMEAVGRLAGGIAHDFNNLLTVIGLSVASARAELSAGHSPLGSLAVIEQAVTRAEGLVRQILAFGRKQPTSRTVVRVGDAVLEATGLLRATLPAGIQLNTAVSDPELCVHADATQLQQILINLGTNAWQAIEGGRGTITFTVDRLPSGATIGGIARIRVRDDGIGIAPEAIERIFEPFFTTKGPGKGSGLGLSVVHGIVEEHGGSITVESAPGRGATFEVLLNAVDGRPARPVEAPREIVRGDGRLVLYVDDETLLLAPVCQLIEHLGYRAVGMSSPREALEALRAAPDAYAVVITDLSMPELSGLELARALHAIRPDLPIVLVSGFAPHADEQLAELGIAHRLVKPFGAQELGSVLGAIVR